jgi:hypothetical protein
VNIITLRLNYCDENTAASKANNWYKISPNALVFAIGVKLDWNVAINITFQIVKSRQAFPPAAFVFSVQRLLLLLRCGFKWQLHIAQVAFGFYQNQRALVDNNSGRPLARNMHWLRLGSGSGPVRLRSCRRWS